MRRTPVRTAREFFRRASEPSTSPTAEKQPGATPPTKLAPEIDPNVLAALVRTFPCGGCEQYLGAGQHLKICAVNYRGRALAFAKLLGLT
jgi:hypothetical protein